MSSEAAVKEKHVQQNIKHFSARLNECLDNIEAPASTRERATILSKLLTIPKQEAWSLIEGHHPPSPITLEKLSQEFDVPLEWLMGEK
jgi:hypothetical protein